MNKKTIDKVLEILSKHGIDEETLVEVEGELNEKTPDEKVDTEVKEEVEEPTPDVAPVEGDGEGDQVADEPNPDEGDVPEGEGDPLPPVDTPADDVPPVDDVPAPDGALPEGVNEVNPMDVAPEVPTDPTNPVDPVGDPVAQQNDIEEYQKAIDGLVARIDALENALREGGILSDEKGEHHKEVGVNDPTYMNDYHDDDEIMDRVLENINKKHY